MKHLDCKLFAVIASLLRRSSVGAALAVLVLFKVPSAFADPIAEWAGPWRVTLLLENSTPSGDVQLRRAFGENAQKDGEILNIGFSFEPLSGTQAWAKVYGQASSSICVILCGPVFGDTGIVFERAFRLEGSPSGEWEVALIGRLVGDFDLQPTIVGAGIEVNPQANVFASVSISAVSDPATKLLQFNIFQEEITPLSVDDVDDPLADKGVLPNGIYLVRGELGIDVEVEESRFETGVATADFFAGEAAGLRVGVAVAPRVTLLQSLINSIYQSLRRRLPTDEEVIIALAYLQAGGTPQGLRGRLLAKLVPVL
jgi:hypothetical protein